MEMSSQLFIYTLITSCLGQPSIIKVENSQFNSIEAVTTATTVLSVEDHAQDFLTAPNPISDTEDVYDYIVVGGGSAGCVIASRLSENPANKVLLLEAGGNPNFLHSVPAMTTHNLHHPETDWMYPSKPSSTACLACKGHSIHIGRGKVLGGCSTLNLMVYMRGNPNDFDNWANLTDDQSWSYENVLPFFKKSEDYKGNYPDPKYHGKGGPLSIESQSYHPLWKEWMSAGKEMGFNNTDANAYQTSTFYPIDVTMKEGVRWSTYMAFLKPALERPNLKVIRYAHVKVVNFDPSKRAIGVTYFRNDKTISVKASKEVILSAGAIGTPHLLMLSGIGHAAHLNEMDIPVISDLHVGDNLQDHVISLAGPFILNETVSFVADRDLSPEAAQQYIFNKTGTFSFNFVTGIGLFSTTDPPNPAWPNLYTIQAPVGIHKTYPEDYEFLFGFKKGTMSSYLQGFIGRDTNFVGFNLGLPKSTGTIRLKSADPFEYPIIDHNYYSDKDNDDIRQMTRAFRLLIKMYEGTKTFKRYNATLIPNHFPGCEQHKLRSDAYFECYLRHFTGTTWHHSCTAKMGRDDDPTAVVDSRLRVRGVKGLRVADASIMPVITNANLNAPTIMIGEKAADMILKDNE